MSNNYMPMQAHRSYLRGQLTEQFENFKNSELSKHHLSDDITRRFRAYFEPHLGRSDFDLDEVASKYAFVVTLRADEGRSRACKAMISEHGFRVPHPDDPRPYTDVRFDFTEFDHIFNVLNKQVYGSKWREPARRRQLPFVAVFLDYDGSKYDLGAPDDVRGLHLHALIAFPPSHIDRAKAVLKTLIRDLSLQHPLLHNRYLIEAFDPSKATILDPGKSAVQNCLEYCMKGAMKLMARHRWSGELYRLYPNPNGRTYNYPRPPAGSPERKVPFADDPDIQRARATRLLKKQDGFRTHRRV